MYKMGLGLFALVSSVLVTHRVSGHGRLLEPLSRASMWRYGYNTTPDYDDNAGYCGGFTHQWTTNKGKCGICGDAWELSPPRPHETGGIYGKGIIVKQYKTGSKIKVRVQLTANHLGYFEFRTCPMIYRGKEVDQQCLDKYLLRLTNGTARYYPGSGNREFQAIYKLPDDLSCSHCVFQWRYIAGNSWGDCGDGTEAIGCGPQEEFRACADITIGDEGEDLLPEEPPSRIPGESTQSYWLLSLLGFGMFLLLVFAVIYYHRERAKRWLREKRLILPPVEIPPVALPRHKRQPIPSAQWQL